MNRAALVLAGGRSTRMGRDKATLELEGVSLLERVLAAVEGCVQERAIVCRAAQQLPPLSNSVARVHDELEDQGPLGGLGPGLRALRAPVAFVTACDAPLLSPAVVELLFARLGEHDVAVAKAQGRLQPLCAVYRTALSEHIERLLKAGLRRPVDLFREVSTVEVEEAELRSVDAQLDTLRNVNTPQELEDVRERMGPAVKVEFYEGARQLAGQAELVLRARTLGAALREASLRAPALKGRVLGAGGTLAEHWRASLNGQRWIADPQTPLSEGDAVVLVSALAGG